MRENRNEKIKRLLQLSGDVKISSANLTEIIKKILNHENGFCFDDEVLEVIKNKISSGDLKEKELFVENLKLMEKEKNNENGEINSNLETLRKLIDLLELN